MTYPDRSHSVWCSWCHRSTWEVQQATVSGLVFNVCPDCRTDLIEEGALA